MTQCQAFPGVKRVFLSLMANDRLKIWSVSVADIPNNGRSERAAVRLLDSHDGSLSRNRYQANGL